MFTENNTLYVGNLSYDINERDLSRLFSPYGVVTRVQLPRVAETNRLKGFAFVEMTTAAAALAAMSALNGTEFQGRDLNITLSKNKADIGSSGGSRGSGPRTRY